MFIFFFQEIVVSYYLLVIAQSPMKGNIIGPKERTSFSAEKRNEMFPI